MPHIGMEASRINFRSAPMNHTSNSSAVTPESLHLVDGITPRSLAVRVLRAMGLTRVASRPDLVRGFGMIAPCRLGAVNIVANAADGRSAQTSGRPPRRVCQG